jgi:hypothetical protein
MRWAIGIAAILLTVAIGGELLFNPGGRSQEDAYHRALATALATLESRADRLNCYRVLQSRPDSLGAGWSDEERAQLSNMIRRVMAGMPDPGEDSIAIDLGGDPPRILRGPDWLSAHPHRQRCPQCRAGQRWGVTGC